MPSTNETSVPNGGVDAALCQQRGQGTDLIGKQDPAAPVDVVEAAPDQRIRGSLVAGRLVFGDEAIDGRECVGHG